MEKLLATIGLSSEEVKVYLFLLENGSQNVSHIAKHLGYPRPSLYGFLSRLQTKGVVTETLKDKVKYFSACKPEKIQDIFGETIDRLESSGKKEFAKLLPSLQLAGTVSLHPKLEMYEGVEGVKFIMKDVLLYRNLKTESFWPIQSMIDILTPEFFRYLNKERIPRNIYTRAIWPESQVIDTKKHPYLGSGKDFLREIRVLPKGIDFSLGHWIYGNKVAFISSKKEAFGFIIESKEFADMLRVQFELIWNISKKLEQKPNKETEAFLHDIYAKRN